MTRSPRVLLLGSDGMLGTAWHALLEARGLDVVVRDRAQLDLTNRQSIQEGLRGEPTLVVNCAAWTDVDEAEANEARATAINGTGTGWLAEGCAKVGALLIHYSTDYVFDGLATRPYPVSQPRTPLNAYVRGKARGEELIEQSGCRHLILRTSWLFAPWGNNFVRTMARLCQARDSLRVVNDQRGRPTSVEHLSKTSLALAEREVQGTFHVCNGGQCTWYELAKRVVTTLRPECQVEPCSTAEFPRPALRPAYSVLDLTSTEAVLGPMTDWRDGLAAVLRKLES